MIIFETSMSSFHVGEPSDPYVREFMWPLVIQTTHKIDPLSLALPQLKNENAEYEKSGGFLLQCHVSKPCEHVGQ